MSNTQDQLAALGLSPELVTAHLTGLSLVRATNGVPRVLTNEQRAQLLRAVLPSPTYNEHDWQKLADDKKKESQQ